MCSQMNERYRIFIRHLRWFDMEIHYLTEFGTAPFHKNLAPTFYFRIKPQLLRVKDLDANQLVLFV